MEIVLQDSCGASCVEQLQTHYQEIGLAYGSGGTENQLPIESYSTASITCLICDNTVTSGISIYTDETNFGPITGVLSNILDQFITDLKIHSEIICSLCYDVVKDFNEYTLKIQQIKQNVRLTFDTTLQKHCTKQLTVIETQSVDEGNTQQEQCTSEIKQTLKSTDKSSNVKKYECPMCKKRFRAYSHRVEHMLIHLNEKPHKCDTCDKMFRTKNALKVHTSSHTGVKKYTCNQCGKGYADRYYYYEHMRVHSGERPFKCEYCNRTFARRKDMTLHARQHTNEKPHKCTQCSKAFVVKSRLDRHLTTHSGLKPFTCEYCSKSFSREADKVVHVRTHTGQKPFSCCYCNKTFANQSNCLVHMRGHSGETKQFKCLKCDLKFGRRKQLQEHKKTCLIQTQSNEETTVVQPQEQTFLTAEIPAVSQSQLLQVQEIIEPFTIPQVAWGNTATIDTPAGTYNVTSYILN